VLVLVVALAAVPACCANNGRLDNSSRPAMRTKPAFFMGSLLIL
jgi:hypothetical protein